MNKKGFHQLKWDDRVALERMLKINTPKNKIAEALGVCRTTIYNEINRGKCLQMTSDYEFVERYCPEIAEQKYQEFLRAKGPDLKLGNDHAFAEYVEHRIIDDRYSPGAVLAEVREQGLFDTDICESTLYNYIYRGDVFMELAPEHLHEKGRRHKKKNKSGKKKAARPPKGESIERRPAEVADRSSFGHWEMDSVMGTVHSQRALLVLTERLTRGCLIIPVPDHTAASVVRALNGLERRMGRKFYEVFKSITIDNGCEFQDYEGMEKSCRRKGKRTTVYYCHPYAPHERGSNENTNRLIRRFFPKGTNFDEVDVVEIRKAERWINDYPRKLLGWKTANALMQEYMAA